MNLRGVLLIAAAFLLVLGANAQRANRSDLCQAIPNLSLDQQQKIDKLSVAHQNKMDALRTQFYAECDGVKASGFKTQMNTEMKNHYRNVSGLLTTEQQTWFDQNCNVNTRRGNYNSVAYGRSQGYGRNQAYGRGQGNGRGQGYRRGPGKGQGRLSY